MKYLHPEKLNERLPRQAWLLSLAAIAIAPFSLTRQAAAQVPPQIQQIPPQQLQDIQRAIQPPLNQPTNQQLIPPFNQSPFTIDQTQPLDIQNQQQLQRKQPGTQKQPLLEIDPYYQSDTFQRDLQQDLTSPAK